jgi:hypothetical protein
MPAYRWVAVLLLLCVGCASTRGMQPETGEARPLEHAPTHRSRATALHRATFEEALSRLVMEMPLPIRPAEVGTLIRASTRGATLDTAWQRVLRRDYGQWCKAYEAAADCLSLLEDGLQFNSTDKLALALGFSMEPMRESLAEAVRDTLSPQLFHAVVVTALASWVALAAVPEPILTKSAAVLAAVLIVYLGIDTFLAVVRACFELKQSTDSATTFRELEDAGARFGGVLGLQGARVFVLAVTVLVSKGTAGSAAWLSSRMPLLPGFAEASAVAASQVGLRLAAVGEIRAVTVAEGSLSLALAPGALAMTASGSRGPGVASAAPPGFRAWISPSGLRKALGPAGPGRQWHHIVEQTPGNARQFGPYALHNTQNVIPLDKALHEKVSAFYSSKRFFITNSETLTVRQWLSTQPFAAQRDFGLMAIKNIQQGVWR